MTEKTTPRWRRRLWLVLIAPAEVIACAAMGAWEYGRDSAENIRDLWRSA